MTLGKVTDSDSVGHHASLHSDLFSDTRKLYAMGHRAERSMDSKDLHGH